MLHAINHTLNKETALVIFPHFIGWKIQVQISQCWLAFFYPSAAFTDTVMCPPSSALLHSTALDGK